MCAHNDARSKLKYLAYFPVQGVFRAPGTDVSNQSAIARSFEDYEYPEMIVDDLNHCCGVIAFFLKFSHSHAPP
jgi:hypothetical protein